MATTAKTKPTEVSVTDFLSAVPNEQRRADAFVLLELMQKITGHEPKMWGPSIVGFGSYHYKYASGHEGDACAIGFAARKDSLVLYLMGRDEKFDALLATLGKYKSGTGCLYIKKLADVDAKTLTALIKHSFAQMKKQYQVT